MFKSHVQERWGQPGYLEESDEDVRVGETAEGEGQEGGEAAVEHRRADRAHRGYRAIFPWTLE